MTIEFEDVNYPMIVSDIVAWWEEWNRDIDIREADGSLIDEREFIQFHELDRIVAYYRDRTSVYSKSRPRI